jgi:hypothetical protein
MDRKISEIMKTRTTKTKETSKEITNGMINKKMSRKEALQKSGYIAAATMMILLNSNKAQAGSSAPATAPSAPTRWSSQ